MTLDPKLDSWLDGKRERFPATGDVPRERHICGVLGDWTRESRGFVVLETVQRLRDALPRICRDCGAAFEPRSRSRWPSRWTWVRCPACLARRRSGKGDAHAPRL
jgi:hypothetical protein